ncbi:MAG: glyoxalase [Actinobacteria bacterium]|nr:glyoxalase [Actinomycetota bacterium]
MTAVVGLTVAGPSEPWRAIGLRVVDGVAWIGGIALRFADQVAGGEGSGLVRVSGWTLAGSPDRVDSIDGIATDHVELDDAGVESWEHPLGVTSFDHVVVMTSSLERTCGEIERITGEPLKRIREVGPIRQGFHRLGSMIVEVVESDRVTSDEASLWGFVWIVDDLHDTADRLGPDLLSPPKAAVQPGRFIASFRTGAGLGLPIALMSPDRR